MVLLGSICLNQNVRLKLFSTQGQTSNTGKYFDVFNLQSSFPAQHQFLHFSTCVGQYHCPNAVLFHLVLVCSRAVARWKLAHCSPSITALQMAAAARPAVQQLAPFQTPEWITTFPLQQIRQHRYHQCGMTTWALCCCFNNSLGPRKENSEKLPITKPEICTTSFPFTLSWWLCLSGTGHPGRF